MSTDNLAPDPDPEVPARAKTRMYSAVYKARIVAEYEGLDKAGKGALLRREGLYTSLVSAWRHQREDPASHPAARSGARSSDTGTALGVS